MSTEITFDALNEASELAPTAENFPALKHFFPCYTSEEGGSTLTDIIGDVVFTGLTGLVANGNNNALMIDNTGLEYPITGSWASPSGNADMLLVVCVGNGLNNVNIGHAADQTYVGIQVLGSGSAAATDGRNVAAGKAQDLITRFTTPSECDLLVAQWLNGTSMTAAATTGDADNASYYDSGSPETVLSADTDLSAATFPNVGLLNASYGGFKGIQLWMFEDGLPEDLEAGLLWMHNEWHVNENRGAVYPGWRGVK